MLASAKGTDPAPGDARARLDARLAGAIAAGLGATASAHAARGGSAWGTAKAIVPWVATFALGGVVGGAIARATMEPPAARVVYVDRPVSTARAVPSVAVDAGTLPAAPAPSPATTTAPRGDSIAAERAILDGARRALEQGDGATALSATERHARTFPGGALVQEREGIAIRALVLLGRRDEGRARAQRFVARYPDSLLRPAVEAAVANP